MYSEHMLFSVSSLSEGFCAVLVRARKWLSSGMLLRVDPECVLPREALFAYFTNERPEISKSHLSPVWVRR